MARLPRWIERGVQKGALTVTLRRFAAGVAISSATAVALRFVALIPAGVEDNTRTR